MSAKKLKATKIKVNKLDVNPLFIRFLNWKGDKHAIEMILEDMLPQFPSNTSTIKNRLLDLSDDYLNNLSDFQKKFKMYLVGMMKSYCNLSAEFLAWLENSFKYIKEEVTKEDLNEERKIIITNEEGRWLEAIICYNFIMTYNYFGGEIIKQCPVCASFFSNKGKYARYCNDACKESGKVKK